LCLDRKACLVKYQASFFYFMHKEPIEIQDEQPTLEDLRAEIGRYDDKPLDDGPGWDLGKDESL
jgi:hypothetical protein